MVSLSSVLFFASIICLGVEGLVDALAYPVAVGVPVPVLVPVNVEQFIGDVEAHEEIDDDDEEEEEQSPDYKTEDEEETELVDVGSSSSH